MDVRECGRVRTCDCGKSRRPWFAAWACGTARYCRLCKPAGAVRVTRRRCMCPLKRRPIYCPPQNDVPRWCSACPDRCLGATRVMWHTPSHMRAIVRRGWRCAPASVADRDAYVRRVATGRSYPPAGGHMQQVVSGANVISGNTE